MFESEAVFTAYATIDACYFCMQQVNEQMQKPRAPIERMIDETTGYGVAKAKERAETLVSLLEQIIENKKFIEAETSRDEQMLTALKQFLK